MPNWRLFLMIVFCAAISAVGQVNLPRLISDGIVLQRDAESRIWGWASDGEEITVHFLDSTYRTKTDSRGEWSVVLAPSGAGGPYEMHIAGSSTLTIHNILVGDVWVCSGQSNMELPMKRVSPLYGAEIAHSENAFIRQFAVPQTYNFNEPQDDLQGGSWKSANPENILDFSAAAYFFAVELYKRYKVPIGLLNASLGGSPVEAWMSEPALASFPVYLAEAQRFRDSKVIHRIEQADNTRIHAWYRELRRMDQGYKARQRPWYDPRLRTTNWSTMQVPGYWSDTKLGPVNGVVWFRKKIDVPSSFVGKRAMMILGRIVDADSAFINGRFVGTTGYQYPPRRYDVPPDFLKNGQNSIVVRVISNSGSGGFVPDKVYALVAGNDTLDLTGPWQYRLGARMKPLASQTFIRWKPLGLYNAMIAPLIRCRIRGVIWYQGESNASRPVEYRELFPALIRDWRRNWNQGDVPFLYVQLPNFLQPDSEPSESDWALLRESQRQALSLPATGMAVTIDIGEWNDVHPLNKKDVGMRLALAAERVAYGDTTVVYSGPTVHSMRNDGSKIALSFTHVGSGLIARDGGELKSFAIAGADKHFVWANAKIENDSVIVWSEAVPAPVAVRYAWANNPVGANLCNKEGLPASPFRTDDWPSK